ncbi:MULTISPECIES: hypothetical protein [unclassified Streptomyces]|uniref:hypothetical protein n=1 Tax=unclassified Streptomyces TaxID=2593676 RepID=UPI0005A72E7A|nr:MULTISPECIES: hypothetical protein [unclassified Streptomyces]
MSRNHFVSPTPAVPWPPDQDRRAWVAPAVATALLVFLVPSAFLLGAMSAMATDSCGPDDCSQALTTSLNVVYGALPVGGLLTFCTWLTSWVLPWRVRWSGLRAWMAVFSLPPPLFVILLVFNLPQG